MCFLKTKGMGKLVAKEAIPTTKIVSLKIYGCRATIKSPVFGFTWWSGDIKELPRVIKPEKRINLKVNYDRSSGYNFIDSGYHSNLQIPHNAIFKTTDLVDDIRNGKYVEGFVLMDATIQIGTEYYINRFGEVVSSYLVLEPVINVLYKIVDRYSLCPYPLKELFSYRLRMLNK